jgi:hypothetical protein
MPSHMKKKAKRYQEGGEAEDKKRGLAASNKEGSVGFFERLRMGNIDDPKSEAYKRFGAGRGKAEAARTKASTIDQVGEYERRKEASAGPLKSQAASSTTAPTKTTVKPAIVTKEQMKKEGFDNLRDYLNFKQNKKRRVTKDSEGKTASGMSREARGVRDDSMSDKDRLRAQLDSAKESSQAGRYGTMKKGGMVKSSASKRADGIAKKGKTKGRMV